MAKKKNKGGALKADPPKSNVSKEVASWQRKYNDAVKTFKKQKPGSKEQEKWARIVQRWGAKSQIPNWEKALGNYKAPTPEEKFTNMSPEDQRREMEVDAMEQYRRMMEQASTFDPNKPFAGYEMGFGEARDKAYTDVMNQFNRSMEPEFQRQNAEFQQRMADQGLDPNSGAYQAQYKAMADAQNNARLNAQSQASQQAYQVQQQAFGQGQIAAMTPFEQWQASKEPFILPYQQAGDVNLANIQGSWQQKMQAAQNAAAIKQANIAASTSRANTAADIASREEMFRQQQIGQYPTGEKPKKPNAADGFKQTLPSGVLAGSQ
jgi:hypothetical protein